MPAAADPAHTDRPPLGLLLGDDGSPSGLMALRLLSATRWPEGTWLRRAAAMEGFAQTNKPAAASGNRNPGVR